eukprot:2612760-Rhodomonas_salina.1
MQHGTRAVQLTCSLCTAARCLVAPYTMSVLGCADRARRNRAVSASVAPSVSSRFPPRSSPASSACTRPTPTGAAFSTQVCTRPRAARRTCGCGSRCSSTAARSATHSPTGRARRAESAPDVARRQTEDAENRKRGRAHSSRTSAWCRLRRLAVRTRAMRWRAWVVRSQ